MDALKKARQRMAQECPRAKSEGVGGGLRSVVALCAILAILSGCSHFPSATADNCAGWRQINPNADDSLTDRTAGQILSHNLHGAGVCAWVPPTKKASE